VGRAVILASSPAAMEATVALEVMVGSAGLEAAVALLPCCSEMVGRAATQARSPAEMEATVALEVMVGPAGLEAMVSS
jgi:hypothetical protein